MDESIRVLHVDDDPDYVEMTATFLEQQDAPLEVHTATTTAEGLERLQEDSVDCVISDYDMPQTDGLAFLETVRSEYPDLPFILFTGKGSEEIASEAISAGVTDYLQKETGADHYVVLANRVMDAVDRVRSEVSYHEVFDKAGIGLTVRDIETGDIIDVNQRYCEMLGYDRDEVLNLTLDELTADLDGYDAERGRALLQEAIDHGTVSFEWPDETKDGDVVWVDIDMRRAKIDGRERLLVTVQDITERKAREDELKRQNDRLERVISVISHDLRNPLSVATGQLELAQAKTDIDHVDKAVSSLDRIAEIVDGVLMLARTGHRVDPTDSVDLDTMATGCWANVDTRDASLIIESNVALKADEVHIRNLLENLIRNAVEHGGATVTVYLGELSGKEGFYVEDDGSGIPSENREQVFESGFSSVEENVGLGLNIVREIAESHGWDVRLTDSQEGGTRFEFTGVTMIE